MFDFGCHRLEVLTHLFGPVRRVTGMLANVLFVRDVEDTATALLQFERGVCGVVAVTHAAIEPRDTVEIFGSRGSFHVPSLNKGELRIRQGERRARRAASARGEFSPAAHRRLR